MLNSKECINKHESNVKCFPRDQKDTDSSVDKIKHLKKKIMKPNAIWLQSIAAASTWSEAQVK